MGRSRASIASRARELTTAALASAPVTSLVRASSRQRLRILAYHDIADPAAFRAQLAELVRQYRPVSGAEVLAAVERGRPLPAHALWLTFDDAYPRVLRDGLTILTELALPATVFVCPGVVGTAEPYWWQAIEAALDTGCGVPFRGGCRTDVGVIAELKRIPDDERREIVEHAAAAVRRHSPDRLYQPQVTTDDLQRWLDSGREIGNHTWDHPCLDTCDAAAQKQQIRAADTWLREQLGVAPTAFAYPNGNVTATSQQVLDALGYPLRLRFDHRLASTASGELSRLRIDASADSTRSRAIASGAHSLLFHTLLRLHAGWHRSTGAYHGASR